MIQSENFRTDKRIAQLPQGIGGRYSYIYWSDLKRQYESSSSSSKPLDLIGSQSMPVFNLPDVKRELGQLSGEEKALADEHAKFYSELAAYITSVDREINPEPDIYETLLDMRNLREISQHPARILEIGPGSGRNFVAFFLDEKWRRSVYAGTDSVALCYNMQNMAGAHLKVTGRLSGFHDLEDYKYDRREFPDIRSAAPGTAFHMPLWETQRLPDSFFDLIICNYVLDEIPAHDFMLVADLCGRCLAPEGLVYCRGSQEKSMLRDLYLYGYGTYHNQDITATMLSKGLKVVDCRLQCSHMTRLFARKTSVRKASESEYNGYASDVPLVRKVQEDFVRTELKKLSESGCRILLWGQNGTEFYLDYVDRLEVIKPFKERLNMIGMTHRFITHEHDSRLGLRAYPVDKIKNLAPDVVLVASMNYRSIIRQLRGIFGPGSFELVRRFNYPISFAFLKSEGRP